MENQKAKNIITVCLAVAAVFLIFGASVRVAQAATLRFSPGTGNFLVGSTFDLSIILDTKAAPINFIEAEFFFPADKLQLTSPSVGKSIIQFWPTPPVFSNVEGRVYFAGGSPAPGINVSEGLVLSLTFRVISAGEAEIQFGDKTSVLAHDGMGTEVLTQKSSAFFRFSFPPPLGPPISSPTHPDQEKWYRDKNPIFVWPKSPGAEAYSFKLDQDPVDVLDTTSDSEDSTASFSDLDNGIWYFHLREKARGVWGGVSRYAVKIDNEPPAQFRVNISPSARTTNPNPIFRFFTTDALSGLSHWEMKIIPLSARESVQALFFGVDSPYQAINLEPGRYHIVVRAIDKAGNVREETTTIAILSPYADLTAAIIRDEGINLAFLLLPWHYFVPIIGFVFLILLFIISKWLIKQRFYIKYALKKEGAGKNLSILKKKGKNKEYGIKNKK